jgi:subtilisin family serine protease
VAIDAYFADGAFLPAYQVALAATSNDPAFTGGQQWGMYGNSSTPSNSFGSQAAEAWAAGVTGSTRVVVAVQDSGIDYTHIDLYLNIWLNQQEIPSAFRSALIDTDGDALITFWDLNHVANVSFVTDVNANGRIDGGDLLADTRWANGVDDAGNGFTDDLIGWDFVNNDNNPYDDNGHGTHVAGTIGALGGNGTGVAGVAWSVQLIAVKSFTADGKASIATMTDGLTYTTAIDEAGQKVTAINMSYGGTTEFGPTFRNAVNNAAKADILMVAAAGNSATDNDVTPFYPSAYDTTSKAGYDAVIAVASITTTGDLSSFSNYGLASVDLGAPGSDILSTLPGDAYGYKSGTSMATPHVTGAIALYAAANPSATAAEIRAALLSSTAATASLDGKTVTGGRLDIDAMLDVVPCFARGTRIRTPRGETPVEHLRPGDMVLTRAGAARAVRWIGRRAYAARFVAASRAIQPIRIRPGALGPGMPRRDLFLSPLHALWFETGTGPVLVPAAALANGASIRSCPAFGDVQYLHLELDSHDVLLAEGAPAESFIDCDSRALFAHAEGAPATAARPCAPRIEDGPALEAIRAKLAALAGLAPLAAPGPMRGHLDRAAGGCLEGWVQDLANPAHGVALEAVLHGRVVARTIANRHRPDLEAAGIGLGFHGYRLTGVPEGATLRRMADAAPIPPIDASAPDATTPDIRLPLAS